MPRIPLKYSFYIILPFILIISQGCKNRDTTKLFTLLSSSDTGIKFKNTIVESEEFNVLEYGYFYNGGGVSVGDLNNDGLPDIYFTGNMVGSRLYINKGDFEFEEIAEKSGTFAEGLWNTGTTMADVNGDGFLDIYVCRSAAKDPDNRKNQLFINNGDLTFTESGREYGVDDSGYSTQGAFFDYDNDGDLDLYVLNHSTQEYANFGQITGSLKSKKDAAFSDKLYRNDNGKFVDVSDKTGLISNVLGFGLGVAVSDFNNDGWQDIYVSNDYNEQDYLYINNADGTFSEQLEKYIGHTSLFSMGSDVADINNDGFTDIMTLDMLPEGNYRQKIVSGPDNYDKYHRLVNAGFYNQTMRNMLQLNNGGSSFSEIGQLAGISNTDWSWAALLTDLDNDGYKDVFITNGYKSDYTNMDFINYVVQEKLKETRTGEVVIITDILKQVPSSVVENYAYRNNGNLTFTKMNQAWGLGQKSLSNGAAYSDLDNDGDLDLIVNNIGEEAFIYRNNSETRTNNNFLKIKLKGEGKNTFGNGAKVSVYTKGKTLMQEMMPVRGYQSSVDYNLVFGLGETDSLVTVSITWPDRREQELSNIAINSSITLYQMEAKKQDQEVKNSPPTYFTNTIRDSLVPFLHQENNFIDFKNQQLLPHMLSTQGPKIAKGDVNNDGLEDIYLGGAKGISGKLFYQDKSGKFKSSEQKFFENDKFSEDIEALFFDADNDKDLDLYVVSGGYEFDVDAPELQDRLYLNNGKGNFTKSTSLPVMLTSGSCVSSNDMDGDGDFDLFVGGRLVPNAYPLAPQSYILKNDGKGNFIDATISTNPLLQNIGMVTDALWTDFNGDKENDLIIVGEFLGIRTFQNTKGKLTEVSQISGLQDRKGWWNTIAEGDFDNDGDVDYVVGNFGLNSQLKASPTEPIELFVKDFDSNGSIDPILCSYIKGKSYPVFSKDDLTGQLPHLQNKYLNYSDYADQQIKDIFTPAVLKDAVVYEVNTLSTGYIENLGNANFKVSPLPTPIQFAPINSILVHDFNSDGNLDLLMAGNFFGTRVKYGRYDANKGSLLLGNGNGSFEVLGNDESGLQVNGEVRDIEMLTLADGSMVFLFAKNGKPLQTYGYTR